MKIMYDYLEYYPDGPVIMVHDISVMQGDLINLAEMMGVGISFNLRYRNPVGIGRLYGEAKLMERFMESAEILGYEFEKEE